jgi:hypothetical protein
MNYQNLRSTFLLTPAFALSLACDGDLGKDSAGDDAGTDGDDAGTSAAASDGGDDSASSAGTGDGTGSAESGGPTSCDPAACGPAPGADPMCSDGSGAQWNCLDDGTGCSWQAECPNDEPCTKDDCGPAPGAPAQLCPDGVNYSGPGPCLRNLDGACAWTFLDCPACCDPVTLPDCPEPITCCGDGSWVCGDAAVCPGGETALACQDGGTCVSAQGSCSAGETCCAGLTCCAGVPVPEGQEYCGTECPMSDRNLKENFATVDVHKVLDEVSQLEIMTWNYRTSPDEVRHVGPMAQDFKAAFEVGATDKAIFQVDADGVALAAIQALDQEVKTLRAEKADLQSTLADLQRRVDALEK